MVFIPPAPYLPGQGQFLPTYSLGVPSIRGLGNCTLPLPLNTSGCCQCPAGHLPCWASWTTPLSLHADGLQKTPPSVRKKIIYLRDWQLWADESVCGRSFQVYFWYVCPAVGVWPAAASGRVTDLQRLALYTAQHAVSAWQVPSPVAGTL